MEEQKEKQQKKPFCEPVVIAYTIHADHMVCERWDFEPPDHIWCNGSTLMGGGEAGKEAVLPIDLLKSYIREENSRNNGIMAQILSEVIKDLQLVAENNIYLGDTKLVSVMTDMILDKMGQKHRAYRAAKGE